MKKIIAVLVMVVISCMTLATLGFVSDKSDVASADSITGVDVFFIAGQSNASGFSDFYRKDNSTLNLSGDWLAKAKTGLYTNGFNNIFYMGSALEGSDASGTNITTLQKVKVGFGRNANREFGAELGMAEYLTSHYGPGTENPNRAVVIVKYAVGGTSLLGKVESRFGAWLPPSYVSQSQYVNELVGKVNFYESLIGKSSDNYTTGLAYQAFTAIKDAGYTDIDLKGLYWSQGECECTDADRYEHEPALRALISDVRRDLGTVSNNFMTSNANVDVSGASDLDFLISEIAPTFAGGAKSIDGRANWMNMRIVEEAQRNVCNSVANTYLLPTGKYTISSQNAQMDITVENGESYCEDNWHYNGDDMLEIGNEVGRYFHAINNNATTSAKITVNAVNEDGEAVALDKVTLDAGKTYTANVVNGVATFTNLPLGTFEIIVDGFEQIDANGNFIENPMITTSTNSVANKTIYLTKTPFIVDRDVIEKWNLRIDPQYGATVTNTNDNMFIGIDPGAKGVSFRYDFNVGSKSAYFPAVIALNANGEPVTFQLCHWGNALVLKVFAGGTNVSLTTISNLNGLCSAEICVYFEGMTLNYALTNINTPSGKISDVKGSYDVSTIFATWNGIERIGFQYDFDPSAFSNEATAGPWGIYDVQPISKIQSSDKSSVDLTIIGKNIRGVNGVTDANLEGKDAVLSSPGGLYKYTATITNGVASFVNVPFGKYQLFVDGDNYVGIYKVTVATATHKETVRVNSKIFNNAFANTGISLDGDIEWVQDSVI